MGTKRNVWTKLLCVVLTLALGLPAGALTGLVPMLKANAADVWDGTWDGSGFSGSGSTYTITTAKGLAQFIRNCGTGTSYEGCTVYLDADLDLQSIDYGNPSGGKNVYYNRDYAFKGTFDGRGHTIANFRMTNTDHRIGLFRYAVGATFRNVTFTNVYINEVNNNGKNGYAALVGLADGNITIENVHVTSGNVHGYNYVGGIVGEYSANNTLTLTNCSNGARIEARNDRAAGIVGHSKGSVVATNCSNTAYIYAAYSDAGGIAGWIEDDASSFTNCTNSGEITTDSAAGGIFGYFGSKDQDKKMTLIGCTNTGKVTSRKSSDGGAAGGIAGKIDTDYNRHEIKNCVNRGAISAVVDAGGIVGCNVGYGYWENNVNYGTVSCNNDNAGGILGEVEDDAQEFSNCFNNGSVTGKNSVGGILGYGNAAAHVFNRCGNSGAITSISDSAGGIYGYGGNTQPVIEECWNIGTIKAYNDAGGILGHTNHHSYIRRCFNTGSIETYNHNENGAHGGIVGHTSDLSGSSNSNPNMTDCFNWGPVSGGRDDGGLIGKIKDGKTAYYITNSYNAGDVSGTRPYAIISYGGTVGSNVYYNSNKSVGTAQGTAISDGDLRNSSGFSSNYCKNTWGVKIGGTTYYYPILTWYRDLFHFLLWFKDDPTGTNTYMDGDYNAGFYTPDPSRTGFTPGDWYNADNSSQTIGRGAAVYLGSSAPTNQYVVTQELGDVRSIHNETIHRMNWTRNQYYLDVNGYLDGDSNAGGVGGYGTFDMYVNGSLVADDVNDFWQQIYYEDTYEIRDIKAASGKAYIGVTEGALSGTMGAGAVNIRLQFKSQYTVTFIDGNGNTVDTQTVLYGENAAAPQMTEYLQKTGDAAVHYHWLGTWDTAFTNVTSDLTVTGNYETQQHPYGAYESMNAANHIRVCPDCGFVENTMHHFTAQTVNSDTLKTAATCTDAAVYYYSCAECGLIERDDAHVFTSGTANGHAYGDWNAPLAPTCSAAGHVGYYYCAVCEKYFDAEYNVIGDIEIAADPDAHSYGAWEPLDENEHQRVCAHNPTHVQTEAHGGGTATCKVKAVCTVCGATYGDYAAHQYGEWVPAQAATCSAAGHVGYYYCAVCEKYFDAEYNVIGDIEIAVDPDAHSYGAWTKLDDEKHQRVCAYSAAHVETEDHDWDETGSAPATCLAQGTTSYECTVCRATKTVTGDYGGHTYTATRAEADYLAASATCIAPARYYYACAVCGLSENDPAHTFENGEPDTVNGHQLTHYNAKAPTCTAAGWEAYDACALCDYTTYAGIPATGHHYAEPAPEDWTWTRSGDTFTAAVTVTCEQNDDTTTLTASVSLTEDVAATPDGNGHKTFTAEATVGEGDKQQTFTDTKTLDFYYVSVASGTGVTVTGADTGSYEAGTVLTVSAAADPGYDQSEPALYVNGEEAANPAQITVNAPVAITTNDLPLNTYTLTWMDQWGNVLTTATGTYGRATVMPEDPADVRIEDQVWTFDHWDNNKTAGQSITYSSAAETPVITAIYTLTDQAAKYTVTFLNDDNYTVIAAAEYGYNETVVIPGTPVSTNRTKELDYTFLGWSPEVAANVTADAVYVATYETEAHSRIYPVKWVYNDGGLHVVKEENLPYDTAFTAENIPAAVIVRDDAVTHYNYNWNNRIGTALADHIGYGTEVVNIYADYSIDRHVGEPSYEWVGSDADGYTKCVGSFTCTLCGESFTVEDDDLSPYTHAGENCQDRTYTYYFASLSGSGANSYFENQTKTVYGAYGPHIYGGLTPVWNTEDPDNVTCTAKKTCSYCDDFISYPGTVTVDHKEDATCVSPEYTVYHAAFDLGDGWTSEVNSDPVATAPIDADAHSYGPLDEEASVRPVYDSDTDTWSKAKLVFHCEHVSDGSHDKVIENVDRADYSVFDANVDKVLSLPDYDWNPDAEAEVDSGYGQPVPVAVSDLLEEIGMIILPSIEDFPDNLITYEDSAIDEQPYVDLYAEGFIEIVNTFFNPDGTPKEELLNHYDVTFTLKDGTVTSYNKVRGAVVAVPAAPADVDGYAFLGWTLDGTSVALAADAAEYTVTGAAAFTAKYADTPANCTVTFLNADGTELAAVTVAYGAAIDETDIPAIPAREADADNHYLGGWDSEIAATVTVDATYQVVYTAQAHTGGTATCKEKAACTVCGTRYGELADHVYGEWTEAQPATCAAEGHVGYYQCSVCDKYFNARYIEIADIVLGIDPDAHSYGGWTKLDDEKHQRVCAYNAEHTETEAHNWQQTGTTDATCLAAGTVSYECSVCHATKTVTGAYADHAYGEWTEELAATCSAPGHVGYYYCAVCEKYFDAEYNVIDDIVIAIDPDAHSWTWVIDDDPTCGEPGKKHQACALCGDTQAEDTPIPATGNHTPGEAVVANNVDPTCTEGGSYDSIVSCTACGTQLSSTHVTVGALGHDFGEWAETSAPTCTEAGEERRTCSRCPETETRPVEALGHDFGAWAETAAPTCTEAGEERRSCSRCPETETRPVEALGHNWGAWVTVTEPSVEADGLARRTCLRCGETEEKTLTWSGEKDRKVQFVVSGSMHYVVHLENVDYLIYSKTTPAILWYSEAPLTFTVVFHPEWTGDAIVTVNGVEIRPDANGVYTIPAGEDYVKINCNAVNTPDPEQGESHGDGTCKLCGKVHPNNLWGRLIALFHAIVYFFKTLFNR